MLVRIMVKTGPGRSSEEIREAIRSVLKHQEKNFNALFRELNQRGVLGSPNALAKHLRSMDKEVYARKEPGPGIDRRYYGLIEGLPAKQGIELNYQESDNSLREFWLRNPRLAPIGISMGGAIFMHRITLDEIENVLPKLDRHTEKFTDMWKGLLRQYRYGKMPKTRVKELAEAYRAVWEIVVDAQVQEFLAALKEGREPDYLSAVIKLLDIKHPVKDE